MDGCGLGPCLLASAEHDAMLTYEIHIAMGSGLAVFFAFTLCQHSYVMHSHC